MILLEGTRAEARAFAMMDLSSLRIPSCLSDVSSVPRLSLLDWLAPGLARSELTECPLLRRYLGVSRHAADAVAWQKLAHTVQNCARGFLPLTDLNRDGTHAAASAPREGWHLEFLHLRSTSALVSEAAYCFG